MNTVAKIAAPQFRLANLDDYDRIAGLEVASGLASMSRDDWRNLWLNNPLWPRVGKDWPIGWLLEDAEGRLVGSLVNIPTLYTFRGRELICACGRGWVTTPEFRGFALWLMSEYFDQSGADLFINTTVAPIAQAKISALSDRMPLGDFETISYWVTGYQGFAKKALQKMRVPAAGLLAGPAAAALWCKDALTVKSLPAIPASFVVQSVDDFDARFDSFWTELLAQNPDKLLGLRDRRALAWHFAGQQRAGRLWILTVARQGLLRAYAIFKRQDQGDGIRRMQLIDYQTLEPEQDLLSGLLQVALSRCANENLYLLEHVGRGLPTRASIDRHAPYMRKLPCWPFYYRAADPAIHALLAKPEPWAPSMFDGDASFD